MVSVFVYLVITIWQVQNHQTIFAFSTQTFYRKRSVSPGTTVEIPGPISKYVSGSCLWVSTVAQQHFNGDNLGECGCCSIKNIFCPSHNWAIWTVEYYIHKTPIVSALIFCIIHVMVKPEYSRRTRSILCLPMRQHIINTGNNYEKIRSLHYTSTKYDSKCVSHLYVAKQ